MITVLNKCCASKLRDLSGELVLTGFFVNYLSWNFFKAVRNPRRSGAVCVSVTDTVIYKTKLRWDLPHLLLLLAVFLVPSELTFAFPLCPGSFLLSIKYSLLILSSDLFIFYSSYFVSQLYCKEDQRIMRLSLLPWKVASINYTLELLTWLKKILLTKILILFHIFQD